ncbi:unnamed protein product [Calypogeia fissa]
MGNALFRCCTSSSNVVGVNRSRRSFWEKILCSCGLIAPSKQRRSAIIGNVHSNYQRPKPSEWLDSAKIQKSVRYSSRSRSTSKVSISLATPSESPQSLLHATKEGRRVHSSTASSTFLSAISSNSPDTARKLFNKHCYQKLPVGSPPSTPGGDSPDMTRMSFNPHSYQKLEAYSPSPLSKGCPDLTTISFNQHGYYKLQGHSPVSFLSSLSSDSPDMTRISVNEHYHQQLPVSSPKPLSPLIHYSDSPDLTRTSSYQHPDNYKQQQDVDSLASRSPPMSSSSIDMMRKSFNQHCVQQRHSAFPKKCHSPRRHTKPGSGKSSRRKRTGMRSMSHRTSNYSKSPGRAVTGRIEDNEENLNGIMGSQSRKTSDSKPLGIHVFSGRIESDNREKSSKLRSLPHMTSNSKSLGRALKEDNNNDDHSVLSSQAHKNLHHESEGRTVKWRIDDNELAGTPHPSFYQGRAAVVNIIPRHAALALIRRQKAFANRRNVTRSSEHCRRLWRPALESISEAADCETF